jgi:hypothetical protein
LWKNFIKATIDRLRATAGARFGHSQLSRFSQQLVSGIRCLVNQWLGNQGFGKQLQISG